EAPGEGGVGVSLDAMRERRAGQAPSTGSGGGERQYGVVLEPLVFVGLVQRRLLDPPARLLPAGAEQIDATALKLDASQFGRVIQTSGQLADRGPNRLGVLDAGSVLENSQQPATGGDRDLGYCAATRLEPDAAKFDLRFGQPAELHQRVLLPDLGVECDRLVEAARGGRDLITGDDDRLVLALVEGANQQLLECLEAGSPGA